MFCAKECCCFGTAGNSAQPIVTEASSESDRLEKLERAVEELQKRTAELETEVRSLKQQTAAVPDRKFKTKVTQDGKTYVEKSVPRVEKLPIYVQQRGSELKLVLGGFVQVNFEDGAVSAFEGRFGQTAIDDRFRLRQNGRRFWPERWHFGQPDCVFRNRHLGQLASIPCGPSQNRSV
jgi:hypothetical protein